MRPENVTKLKIRETAIALFKEKGFDNVTINDICAACEISKHTFYYHFESKENLLKTLIKFPQQFSDVELTTIMLMESPYDQYCELLRTRIRHFEYCGKEIMKKILVAQLTSNYDKKVPMDKRPMIELQIGFITKSQERNEIANKADPHTLSKAASCLLIGISQIWTTHPNDGFDLEKEFFKLLDTLMIKNKE